MKKYLIIFSIITAAATVLAEGCNETALAANHSLVLGTQEIGKNQVIPLTLQRENAEYKTVSGAIDAVTIALVGLIWVGMIMYFKLKKKKSFVYLIFFTIFYIYLYKVLDYTLLQFQSLLLLKHFLPSLMLNGVPTGKTLNLIPLVTLRLADVKTSLLNILMMMPFGFGLPIITNYRFKKIVISGLFLSLIIESLQFITGFTANITFRIADINDLIFNTIGAAVGYILFVGLVHIFGHMFQKES